MLILLERPWTTQSFGMMARKNGQYKRPIVGKLIDFRVEDFMPQKVLTDHLAVNIIGKLPDITEIGQIDKYFSSTFNDINIITKHEAINLLNTGQYILLPDNPSSKFWEYTMAPWWEFAVVLDEYDGFIKAPAKPRIGEPSPEDIDEKIDLYDENKGKIKVISPLTLDKWITQKITENYILRLKRI